MAIRGGDIGINFEIDIYDEVEYVSYKTIGSTRGAKSWSEVKGFRVEEVTEYGTELNRALLIASNDIAHLVAQYQREYAPIDESKHKDKIVLRDNIVVRSDNGEYTVGTDDIPYATRRNYENNLHPRTMNYIEKSRENHIQEYEDILDSYAEQGADRLLYSMLERSSGATSGYNRGYQRQYLGR